jgi:hypothetical protein
MSRETERDKRLEKKRFDRQTSRQTESECVEEREFIRNDIP